MNRDKIIEHFGEAFYDKVFGFLPKYAEQWRLSSFEQIEYYSLSCIFTCISKKYGACVLKIGMHLHLVDTEHNMLKDFAGNGLCKVYESDIENGVLLIERVMPGTQICDEPNQDIRLNEFCALVKKLYKRPTDIVKYVTYMDWVSGITSFMKSRIDYIDLYNKMAKAEEICIYLWKKYTDRLLLHGDLHHENILLGKDGYIAIDPLGVVGASVFNVSLFIIDRVDWDDDENYDYIVKAISSKLGIIEHDIRALVFIEACRINCCLVEDGDYDEVDMHEVLSAERMMDRGFLLP